LIQSYSDNKYLYTSFSYIQGSKLTPTKLILAGVNKNLQARLAGDARGSALNHLKKKHCTVIVQNVHTRVSIWLLCLYCFTFMLRKTIISTCLKNRRYRGTAADLQSLMQW